ncbi:MAG: TssQ family T6SS-associated lipoprotein [Hydrogenophilales bacterium]|nr:TssQ family T6SS-associated lipoprotein [Hydrogenophilales bacterium]
MNPSRWLVLATLVLLTAGCSSLFSRDTGVDKLSPRKAEQALNAGIQQYEDGELKAAQKSLLDALNLGLAFDSDKVTAHKHLAFIYCSSNQERQCRDEFRRAFDLDPGFKLDRTEIGHPLWGPVYTGVRAELLSRGKIKP